jgi:hypothetical protein
MCQDRGHLRDRLAEFGDLLQFCLLEHDPEKWMPVFGKDNAPTIG